MLSASGVGSLPTIPFPNHGSIDRKLPGPPRHLGRPEADLWRALIRERDFSQAGARAVLLAALEARNRSRQCRLRIDAEGEVTFDRFGVARPHPLLASEAAASAQFARDESAAATVSR